MAFNNFTITRIILTFIVFTSIDIIYLNLDYNKCSGYRAEKWNNFNNCCELSSGK